MNKSELVIYRTPDSDVSIDVVVENENICLTQAQIGFLLGTKRPAITKHLNNIFKSGELNENVVCSKMEHTTIHGAMAEKTQVQQVKTYNLDVILSVGSGGLFGNEKDQSFDSSINTIYQTFDGKELYPSIEEKAAMLLSCCLNCDFHKNRMINLILILEITKITLKSRFKQMIAESRTEEKDIMVKVLVNLINKNN